MSDKFYGKIEEHKPEESNSLLDDNECCTNSLMGIQVFFVVMFLTLSIVFFTWSGESSSITEPCYFAVYGNSTVSVYN